MHSKIRLLLCALLWVCAIDSSHLAYANEDQHNQSAHDQVMNLLKPEQANYVAVKSGPWNSASTWRNGAIPSSGAKVYIPENISIILNHKDTATLRVVRVDGSLRFDERVNTKLIVDTLIIAPQGSLTIGTRQKPIRPDVTAKIIFADSQPIDTNWDPSVVSRGLISHGTVTMYGSYKTPFVQLSANAAKGATTLTLSKVPTNWKVGDKLALTGMRMTYQLNPGGEWLGQDEEKTILGINGNTVTVEPLVHDRTLDSNPVFQGQYSYLANTTRNIIIRSANTADISRRGHVMFMHKPTVSIHNAGFYGLGRTNKDIPVTDNGGSNPRGRYAVHFHQTGDDDINSTPARITGSVVVGSPGWGFVNHESHVIMEDNVAFDIFGSAFVTESGTELGAFNRNIAIRTHGSGEIEKSRVANHDMGHAGSGFWFQSGSVKVRDNVASGHPDACFTFFTRGHTGGTVKASNLVVPAMAGGLDKLSVDDVPIQLFKGNRAHACASAFTIVDVEINGTGPTRNVIEDFVALNPSAISGILIEYSRNVELRNVKVLRDSTVGYNEWHGKWGIRGHNLIDHRQAWDVRRPFLLNNVTIHNFQYGFHNYQDDNDSPHGTCCGEKAKVEVWNNSLKLRTDYDFTGRHLVSFPNGQVPPSVPDNGD